MIKFVTNWSNPGGSTTAFINLVNALNQRKIPAVLYGPHQWHLDKCKAKPNTKLKIFPTDYLVFHFFNPDTRFKVRKQLLSCHEQDVFPLNRINYKVFDKIHYVSEHQRAYHNIEHPYFILPNVLEELVRYKITPGKVGGIIGSVDRNKQVHVSIERALADGCDRVLIFGLVTDMDYYRHEVAALVDGERVKYMGYCDNKTVMYESITDVYHSSIRETWGYIAGECAMLNIPFHGNESTAGFWQMMPDEIIKRWLEELEYDEK